MRFSLLLCLVLPWLALGQEAPKDQTLQDLKQELEELKQHTRRMEERIRQLETAASTNGNASSQSSPAAVGSQPTNATPVALTNSTGIATVAQSEPRLQTNKWSPSQPITLMKAGSAYMNVSFDAMLNAGGSTASDPSERLELGDHDPSQRGFSMRNAEIALDGAVDPYFKGFANIAFKLDKDASTEVELEEAYLMTTSLPGNLQLKAGQFFAEFGRQNNQHPHQWAFVDQPLILNRMFGAGWTSQSWGATLLAVANAILFRGASGSF